MKRIYRLLSVLLALMLFLGAPAAFAQAPNDEDTNNTENEATNGETANDEGDPDEDDSKPAVSAPEITHFNLSFDNDTHLLYRIDFSALTDFEPNKSNCGVLFWKTKPTDPTVNGGGKLYLPQTTEIEGKTAYVVKYTELSAYQMCDTVWAVPFAVVDSEYRYGETVEYSIVEYAKAMLVGKDTRSDDAAFCTLLRNMLSYGDAAQKYFKYKTDTLPTDVVLKGSVNVTFDWGLYNSDKQVVTVERGVKGAAKDIEIAAQRECYEQTGWYLGDELFDFENAILDEDITLTARYKLKTGYTDVLFNISTDGTCMVREVVGSKNDLTQINIPKDAPSGETVTSIMLDAFKGCTEVTSITLPDSIKSINDRAFADCTKVTAVELPASVSKLGRLAFARSTKITLAAGNENFEFDENGVLYDADKETLISYPIDATATSYTLPDTVTEISAYAFSGNTKLETIVFSKNLESIEDNAFEGCTKLTGVDLSQSSLWKLGAYAFRNCTALETVVFNDDCYDIYEFVFIGCTSLTGSITLPHCWLYGGLFKDCTGITELHIDEFDSIENNFESDDEDEVMRGNFDGWTSSQKVIFDSLTYDNLIDGYDLFSGDDEWYAMMLGSAARVFDCDGNEIKYDTETGVWTKVVNSTGNIILVNNNA